MQMQLLYSSLIIYSPAGCPLSNSNLVAHRPGNNSLVTLLLGKSLEQAFNARLGS